MISILTYVFLGMSIYILIIPILESLSSLICQGIEVLKGRLIYKQAIIQQQVDDLTVSNNKDKTQLSTHAIGFSIPAEQEYEEEYEE